MCGEEVRSSTRKATETDIGKGKKARDYPNRTSRYHIQEEPGMMFDCALDERPRQHMARKIYTSLPTVMSNSVTDRIATLVWEPRRGCDPLKLATTDSHRFKPPFQQRLE